MKILLINKSTGLIDNQLELSLKNISYIMEIKVERFIYYSNLGSTGDKLK